MARKIISPEEGAELKRLYAAHETAAAHAGAVLRQKGMDSPEFLEADRASGALWRRIREILGEDGQPWNA